MGVDMLATIVDRDAVEITGADASTYLQGQISQDVDRITAPSSAWSLVLAPTGRLTAWFRVHRVADEHFLVDLEAGWAAPLVERLERFKLRTAVEFRILDGWRMLSIRNGPGAQETDAPLSPVPGFNDREVLSARFEWPGFSGSDHLGEALVAPSGIELDDAGFEWSRIFAGVPRLGADINEQTIPAEGGAHLIEASVSFTKGCYTGQELVARIDSRGGNVPRPLRVLEADGPLVVGGVVAFEGADVGVVTSAATSEGPSVAIAPLMRKVAPGSAVSVDGVDAVVRAPA
ncbi:MAG: hypothetical protein OXB92_01540 [Acidimicrobiaceae bacterium]|nr:hypothetical protein [Acidimicrobiia bacterium]MCY4492523.1 hypothetical protein [Acidimicrobiaceae bacterium]